MVDGFLGRWSRRKFDAKDGKPLPPEPQMQEPGAAAPAATVPPLAEPAAVAVPQAPPPLTLEDVQALTSESDFSAFVARGVAPEVKNAAMKKLFSDPRYNVMDRLDTYIDDYSLPDPMPKAMLRQLACGFMLNGQCHA